MSRDDAPGSRPAAYALRATYRADGSVHLELIEDWYTALGTVVCSASDVEQIRQVLHGWALQPAPTRSARSAARRTDDAYRLETEVLGTTPSAARRVSRQVGFPEQFSRCFGATPATPSEELDAFTRSLARDVGAHLGIMRRRAAERLADGAYLPVLEAHLERCRALGADPHGYRLIEHTLVPILEDEQYLRIAEDERARRMFRLLEDEVARLYGRCMDVER